MGELVYREAVQNDLLALKDLEQLIIDSERPYDSCIKKTGATYYDMSTRISDSDTYILLVESEVGIVGSGYAQIKPSKQYQTHNEYCHIDFIYVQPKYRGNGVAQKIIKNLEAWATSRGIGCFYLETYAENEAAIRAYKNVGFRKLLVIMEYFS